MKFAPVLAEVINEINAEVFYLDSTNTRERPELLKFRDDNKVSFVPSLLIFKKGDLEVPEVSFIKSDIISVLKGE